MTNKRPTKTAFFVRYEKTDQWIDVTKSIGKMYPKGPKIAATCAMLVTGEVVCFLLLRPDNRAAEGLRTKEISFPHGSVKRLQRRTMEVISPGGSDASVQLHVEIDGVDMSDSSMDWKIVPSSNNTQLEPLATYADLRLAKGGTVLSAFTRASMLDRAVGIGSRQYFGQPGSTKAVQVAIENVISYLTSFQHFRVVTGIEQLTPYLPLVNPLALAKTKIQTAQSQDKFENLELPGWLLDGFRPQLPQDSFTIQLESSVATRIKEFLAKCGDLSCSND